ncbi:hypothetical protein BDQ17DRAFT_1385785 [Cyathus striatus]|nr:hypothetical protein BDQ17DRAFT_1385785 [Cyathus striatus]
MRSFTSKTKFDHNNPTDDSIINECRTLQKEEYEVLESIYPECVSGQATDGTLKLEIPIEFESPIDVVITSVDDASEGSALRGSLAILPPLLLHVSLPSKYPLECPPQLLSLRATHMWLPKIWLLYDMLMNMWQSGEGVLYSWIECLRTGEFLRNLSLVSEDNLSVRLLHNAPQVMLPLLTEYEQSSRSNQFAQNSYPCSICLTSLKGSKCLELSCNHIFCRSCLKDFWGLCIEEGDVGKVGCPAPECVKESREAIEEEVARVMGETEVTRWRWLKEKRSLEKDPTIIHSPVPRPTDVDEESGWARLRTCIKCGFSFCSFCCRTWHGPISACPIAHSEKVVLEYLATNEGSAERRLLEQLYGQTNILRLVARYEEEMASRKWLKSSTTSCPGCECHVEKNLGCNHMTCWKCGKHFCYRCGAKLNAKNPYEHFSLPGGCFNKLFDFQSDEGDQWQPVEGFNII